MERTLDSILPSDIDSTRDNMSYLYGRDPSILAYGERPIPSRKQNLISLYEDEEIEDSEDNTSDAFTLQTIKVYLRIKPFPRKLKLSKDEVEAYQITNSTTLVTKLPNIDHNISCLKGPKNMDTICRNFTFTKTFGAETTQLQLFEQVIQQKMFDFLAGQNTTVMTYGTSNSGKSYTLQGTTTSPGIIPRGLEFVFSNITARATPPYKPVHNSDVISLSAVDRAQELETKNKLLTFASVDKHHYINAYKQMQKLLQEESPIRPSQACDAQYSVWVSFAEIYNENIYDLLSNDCQKRRPLLKLGTDSRGRAFIKGLKAICVSSGSEAYQVLMAGQYNLKVAATALNARSSRSHCIFTIKLLKYYVENTPERVEVSTFSFCDLAGSERLKKTLNVGDRLKEAQNINTSLLVLGRCLKSIYDGQSIKQRNEHVGPFRESKLTRLFQRALSGKEQIVLIVNVNPVPNLYVETQNVLNFAAIAKKIIVEPKEVKRRVSSSRFSQIVAQSARSRTDWDETELEQIGEQTDIECELEQSAFVDQDEFDDLVAENKSLKKELGTLKASMLNRDLQIRQELADTYTAMMKKLESDWKNRIRDVEEQQEDQLEWSVNRVETFYKEKINELTSRKRRRTSNDDDEEDSEEEDQKVEELQIENSRLTTRITSLKRTIKELRESNETAITEKNKVSFKLSLANEELKSVKSLLASAQEDLCQDEESRTYVEKLRTALNDKCAHVKKLKEFLDEAKNEYISITADAGAMERQLKDQAEQLAESRERVVDLEELLEQVNVCLAEQTKATESLEEKLGQQTNLILDSRAREQQTQLKLIESEKTIRELSEKLALLESASSGPKSEPASRGTLVDVQIKEELYSDSEGEDALENSKTVEKEQVENEESSVNGKSEDDVSMDLRAKLLDSNTENEALKQKYAESHLEINSLKEDLEVARKELNDVEQQFFDYKSKSELEKKLKAEEGTETKEFNEQGTSPRRSSEQESKLRTVENGCQTTAISEQDQNVQTSFLGAGSEEKSVQTTIVDFDEVSNRLNELEALRDKYEQLEMECKEKEKSVKMLEDELKNHESECRDNHEPKIADLEKELTVAKVREEAKSECIQVHTNKIAEMESSFALRTKELEDQISEITEYVGRCENEKKDFEDRLKKNLVEIEELEKRIQLADKKEQEKDEEIRQLQKAIKSQLSSDVEDKKVEKEIKRLLKELCETKDALSRAEDVYNSLKSSTSKEIHLLEEQVHGLEKKVKTLEIRERETENEKVEIARLKSENEELTASIDEKEREMETFLKNRDEIIAKYEVRVKTQQEELEREKREIKRFQDLLFHRPIPTTPKEKTSKQGDESLKAPIPVVDLSDSETKRITRRTALAPPNGQSELKKSSRKKRLYHPVDDSCVDLENCESVPPTPSPAASSCSTRSLRTRRK